MRRASSLFDVDQEPLFEPHELEAEAGGELDWIDGFDESSTTPEQSGDLQGHEPEQRSPVPGRRSRMLLVLAAVSAVGIIGSRLTPDAKPPSSLPHTALGPPAVVAAVHPSRAGRQSQRARPLRAKTYQPTRRERTRRAQRAPRAPRAEHRRRAPASAARSAVPVPSPVQATPAPRTEVPAPEPQGFTGEFF